MHLRSAALALLLFCAACSKNEQSQTAVPPAAPPPAPQKASVPSALAAVPAAAAAAPDAPDAPAPAVANEAPAPTTQALRGTASSKPIPPPKAAVVAHPVRPAAVDNSGVERIALMPGSRVSAPPAAPAPVTVSAPTMVIAEPPAAAEPDPTRDAVTPVIVAPAATPESVAHSAEVTPRVAAAPSFSATPPAVRTPANPDLAAAAENLSPVPDLSAAVTGRKGVAALPIFSTLDPSKPISTLNELILDSIQMVPPGGNYRADQAAMDLFRKAVTLSDHRLTVVPDLVRPSFCSEATYLVFLLSVERLHSANRIQLSDAALKSLLVNRQRDGEGVWGRWNANGPGTARLFHELGAGQNFTNPITARPGDFLKIWWNDEIGCSERGHSVIFLGLKQTDAGEVGVRYWSSNKPGGYGEGLAPMSKVKRMLFSRFDNPRALANAARLPTLDQYLADMLKRASTAEEMLRLTGVQ